MRALGRRTTLVFVLGMIGAAMFLGDSFITPAISVLSAVEGLKLATPALEHYVIPITIVILVALFAVQSHGTARVAAFFGPITADLVPGDRVVRRPAYLRRSGVLRRYQSLLRAEVSALARTVSG